MVIALGTIERVGRLKNRIIASAYTLSGIATAMLGLIFVAGTVFTRARTVRPEAAE